MHRNMKDYGYTAKDLREFLLESNAIEKVYDYDSLKQATHAWDYLIKKDVITSDIIKKTHKILMKNQNIDAKYKGQFRDCDVWVGGRIGLSPQFLEPKMLMWCFETIRANPPVDAKQLHIDYEHIHPFIDGNGRTGRMFYNWTRVKRLGLPLHIIHEGQEQLDYYKWFK